jgi:predicted Zn-dependent peptidase
VGATELNGTTSFDRTNYFQNVPTPALDLAMWMESDRMGHLLGANTQEKLDEQRDVVRNERRQGENEPYGTFQRISIRRLHGRRQSVSSATSPPVHRWRNRTSGLPR